MTMSMSLRCYLKNKTDSCYFLGLQGPDLWNDEVKFFLPGNCPCLGNLQFSICVTLTHSSKSDLGIDMKVYKNIYNYQHVSLCTWGLCTYNLLIRGVVIAFDLGNIGKVSVPSGHISRWNCTDGNLDNNFQG